MSVGRAINPEWTCMASKPDHLARRPFINRLFTVGNITLAYLIVGLIWMVFLTPTAALFTPGSHPAERLHALTHLFYVVASSGLLYVLIRRSNREAHRAGEHLWVVLDNLPVMFNSFADDGRTIIFWNKECERVTGYSREELVGNPDALKLLYPDPGYLDRMLPNTSPERLHQYDPRWEITTRSGEKRIIYWPDITEREQAEQERERLIRELDAFAHTVAHDLKNPLDIALTFSHLLDSDEMQLSRDEQTLATQSIQNSVIKMNNIIDELLLLASVDHPQLDFAPLDTGSLVQEAIDRLDFLPEMKDAAIVRPDTWPGATGYPQWVEEVWVNYISNALKYGGRPPRIELSAEVLPDGMIRFRVSDNGPGIPAEKQAELFQPFTRLGDSQRPRATGHGLGLSIVQRIVERLGGQVGVESTPGQGSAFTFTLPQAGSENGKR